ncbi:TadE family protein [Paraburkholderia sp. PREW-6R]|uniref:TadE/TadG family type IV pilus assembly protein n=1 Tax=Paraburkholderia sp. PREW-6R TaxID=3141544 RepID=UPI0031F5D290
MSTPASRSVIDSGRPARPVRARRQTGSTAIEFALIFPLFFVIVYSIVTFSLLMVAQQNLTLAAEEGARAALNWQSNSSLQSALTNRAAAACVAAKAAASSLVASASCTPTSSACGPGNDMRCVNVVMSYDYRSNPILPAIPFLNFTLPATLTSSATVQLNPENIQ